MTLAVMALYADGPSTLRNIASWRVKETDRIAAMATELRKLGATVEDGPDFIRGAPAAAGRLARRRSIHTYDDHRVAMCFSLAAFNPARRAGAHPRSALRRQDLPRLLRDPVLGAPSAAEVPVICIDGPTASGKGTLAAEVARAAGLPLPRFGRALPRDRPGACAAPGPDAGPDARGRDRRTVAGLRLQFSEGKVLLAGEDVSDDIRTEAAGMDASRVSAPAGGARAPCWHCSSSFRRLPGLVADGRDMGTVIFPDADAQGLPDGERRPARRTAA